MEYWFEDDLEEAQESYENTLKQLDFLNAEELKEYVKEVGIEKEVVLKVIRMGSPMPL